MLTIRTTAKAGGKIPFDVRMANQKNLRHAASGSKQCKSASESEAPAFAAGRHAPAASSNAAGVISLSGGLGGLLPLRRSQSMGLPAQRQRRTASNGSRTKQTARRRIITLRVIG